jgi:hypothetical protein
MKYRASGIGNLMVGEIGLSAVQEKRIKELNGEKSTGINTNGNKVKWTDRKKQELESLVYKKDNPELSETTKTFILETCIYNLLGVKKKIKSKFLSKGTVQEDLAIEILSGIDGTHYSKNEIRKTNDITTGECDIDTGKKVIDIKNSWDFFTFFNAEPTSLYEWQGRSYMELWDRDEFELVYVLNDLPLYLFHWELIGMCKKYERFSVIEEINELFPICELEKGETEMEVIRGLQKEYLSYVRDIVDNERVEQLIRNSFFDWMPVEQRVKRFEFKRCPKKWSELEDRMPYVREFEKKCVERLSNYELF